MQDDSVVHAWILGALMGVVALIGLVMASQAVDRVFFGTGLGLCLIGVLVIFGLIHRHAGNSE